MPENAREMAFVTSLRHPSIMKDKQRVYQLLERTLRSVCAQTNQHFKVIVVCNEQPEIGFTHPAITYLLVDIEPPVQSVEQMFGNLDAVRLDKGKKYLAALYLLKGSNPSHVMFFDADDCVANTITQTVLSGPSDRSWRINSGYLYKEGASLLVRLPNGFHKRCGSCFIFSYSMYQLPVDPNEIALDWIKKNLGSHRLIYDYLKQRNVTLYNIPYSAAIYIVNTGENHSAITGILRAIGAGAARGVLKLLLGLRPLTPGVSRRFGLYKLPATKG
jgi:hypothetical protein